MVRPLSEQCGIFAVNPIPDGKNDIKVIILGCVALTAIVGHMFQNGTRVTSVQFSAFVDLVQMLGDGRAFSTKQISYLLLC